MGEVDLNVLLGCPNTRLGMTKEFDVSLSCVLIHHMETQHHHYTTPYLVFINVSFCLTFSHVHLNVQGGHVGEVDINVLLGCPNAG